MLLRYHHHHHQYIKILVVCLSVCDGCGRGRNEFAGRVQIIGAVCKTIACVPAVTEIFSRCRRCCWSGHSELQATRRNPFWTLAIALTTGKNIRLFGVLDQNKIFYLRVTACREQGSHCQDERLAWVASRGQWTSYSNSFVSKVLGANYNRAI